MCKGYTDQLPLAWPKLGTQPATQACALTGNWTGNLSVHRPALNPMSHTSQGYFYFLTSLLSQIRCVYLCHFLFFQYQVTPMKQNNMECVNYFSQCGYVSEFGKPCQFCLFSVLPPLRLSPSHFPVDWDVGLILAPDTWVNAQCVRGLWDLGAHRGLDI